MFDRPWAPTSNLKNLHLRSQVLWSIRQYFHSLDFLEVQTPILSRDTVIDRHIDPISLPGVALGLSDLSESTFYLQTSPEFGMKRLMAAGAQSIYQIGSVFRAGERGDFHNPEFTMIEWYREGDDLQAATQLLADLIRAIEPAWQAQCQTYQNVFKQFAQLCPLSCTVSQLAAKAVELGLGVGLDWSDDRDDWLNLIFAEVVQPRLGINQPCIVTHYPASQSALARVCASDDKVAERFELFVGGIELANGYHELLAANELRRRNELVGKQRRSDGKPALPAESRLLQAMTHGLPPCSGCAMGLDRLLMVLAQAKSIDEIICFPIELA
jgi:elongation factor P--(R)-beta-lysine ligase